MDQNFSNLPPAQQAHALHEKGKALAAEMKLGEALAWLNQALKLAPYNAEMHYDRGNVLGNLKCFADAIASFDRALALKPDFAEAHYNRGNALKEQGERAAAIASYQLALQYKREYPRAGWALAMARIPAVAASDENFTQSRKEFAGDLTRLSAWFERDGIHGYDMVGVTQPFYLAYQEADNRELLAHYGKLCARLMEKWQATQPPADINPAKAQKLRIGIVSAQMYDHSAWRAFAKGWMLHADHDRFELQLFQLNPSIGRQSDWTREHCDLVEHGPKKLEDWISTIRNSQPEILFYPGIGMDRLTLQLASLRLAPVQIATWGHADTTGLPTIDYFLSGELLEPDDAQSYYTEKLVTLPQLGCCIARSPAYDCEVDLAQLGCPPDEPVFICPGTPFKYAPAHDRLLVEIARRVGRCRMIFFISRHRELSAKFRDRLQAAFRMAGLEFSDHVIFIPWQAPPVFHALMKKADVLLDTIGFSGLNTVVQAVECNLPVVTREGRFMRGRFGSAVMKRMGMEELVATDLQTYVEQAVRLATDAGYRAAVRQEMMQKQGVLFDDLSAVRAFEDFLLKVRK